jgi:site-specific recombinase XerD
MKQELNFPALLQAFFTNRLIAQRNASPNTIAAYRDTFRLLFNYATKRLGKAPSALTLEDLNSSFIEAFLNHLEQERRNSKRSRNARLAAIHSFFHYAAYQLPEHGSLVQRVLAIPGKKHERALVEHLTEEESNAILDAPDRRTRAGRRDYGLILLGVQTGLRVTELTGLSCGDIAFGTGAHVRCLGKGRKARCTPLTQSVAAVIKAWISERHAQPSDPLFPNRRGGRLSTDGVQFILKKHVAAAQQRCPSLKEKKISPHVLRHTTAMNLLHAGADVATIALWLGHERLETVHIYVVADLAAKERILAKTSTPGGKPKRFHPDDKLLAFLKSL